MSGLLTFGKLLLTFLMGADGENMSIDSDGSVHRYIARRVMKEEEAPQEAAITLPHYDLLIIIPANAARDKSRLDAVRSTWVNDIDNVTGLCERCHSSRTIKYLFMLGREATERDTTTQRRDAVKLEGASSAYEKLAEKVRHSIRYAVSHYSFQVLLKTDTDSWIFLDRFLKWLEDQQLFDGKHTTLAGDVRRHQFPHRLVRDERNPDLTFTALTTQRSYPIFTAGAGYVLTKDLCNYVSLMADPMSTQLISSMSQDGATLPELQDLPQEDVSMGFWLQAVKHVNLKMPMSVLEDACKKPDGGTYVLDHYVPEDDMRKRWNNLQRTGDPCQSSTGEIDHRSLGTERYASPSSDKSLASRFFSGVQGLLVWGQTTR